MLCSGRARDASTATKTELAFPDLLSEGEGRGLLVGRGAHVCVCTRRVLHDLLSLPKNQLAHVAPSALVWDVSRSSHRSGSSVSGEGFLFW